MRALRAALAAAALLTAPAAVLGEPAPPPPNVRTIPPQKRASPPPATAYTNHKGNNRKRGRSTNPYGNAYPVVINGVVIKRLVPPPAPGPKHTAAARAPHGEDVFETHSTDDAR